MQGKKCFECLCVRLYTSSHHGNTSWSIRVCALMWLNKGQDGISVFGHRAEPVAKGVSWLQCGLPVEKSRQSLSHASLFKRLIFSATYCFLHLLLYFLPDLSISSVISLCVSMEVSQRQECLAASPNMSLEQAFKWIFFPFLMLSALLYILKTNRMSSLHLTPYWLQFDCSFSYEQ